MIQQCSNFQLSGEELGRHTPHLAAYGPPLCPSRILASEMAISQTGTTISLPFLLAQP